MLTLSGVIRSASLANTLAGEGIDTWVGKPWIETVDDISGEKVRRVVEDARGAGVSAFRQVTQRFSGGIEVPIEYTAIRMADDTLMAIGKSLQSVAELQTRLISTQQAREQDYWKLRDIETRYRLLFDATHEAVVMINADTLRVIEANPAAIRALALAPGWDFRSEMSAPEREKFSGLVEIVRQQGRAPGLLLHLGPDGEPWVVRASLIAVKLGAVFMLQLTPLAAQSQVPDLRQELPIDGLIERLPDAFAVLDREGIVRAANSAFLDMMQVAVKAAVIGRPLGRWLSKPGADMGVLLANLRKHRIVRIFSTTITGELGLESPVEVSATMESDTKAMAIGVLIRDVGLRLGPPNAASEFDRPGASVLTGQIGKTPLSTLVTETVGQVERHYIEAALGLADGNRTAAARLLGLSRQGLYAKLNRYGLEASSGSAEGAHG